MNDHDKLKLQKAVHAYGVDVVLEELAKMFRVNSGIDRHLHIAGAINRAVDDIDILLG